MLSFLLCHTIDVCWLWSLAVVMSADWFFSSCWPVDFPTAVWKDPAVERVSLVKPFSLRKQFMTSSTEVWNNLIYLYAQWRITSTQCVYKSLWSTLTSTQSCDWMQHNNPQCTVPNNSRLTVVSCAAKSSKCTPQNKWRDHYTWGYYRYERCTNSASL